MEIKFERKEEAEVVFWVEIVSWILVTCWQRVRMIIFWRWELIDMVVGGNVGVAERQENGIDLMY